MTAGRAYFPRPEGHRRRPRVIRRLKHRLADFVDDPGKLPSLMWAPRQGARRQRPMYRQRREACVTVLQALVHYIDVLTLRVGCRGSEVVGVKLSTIAEQSGLGDRRVDRAIRDLRAGGVLRSYRRSKLKDTGDHIGRTSLRVILRDLWQAFGLSDELSAARKKLARSAPEQPTTKRQRARSRLSLSSALSGLAPP